MAQTPDGLRIRQAFARVELIDHAVCEYLVGTLVGAPAEPLSEPLSYRPSFFEGVQAEPLELESRIRNCELPIRAELTGVSHFSGSAPRSTVSPRPI
jgi:hypothetical protein